MPRTRSSSAREDFDFDGEARFVIGLTEARIKIEKWVKKVLDGPDRPEHEVSVGLFHMARDGEEKRKPIWTIDYDFQDMTLSKLVDEVLEAAEDDVEHFQGKTKYSVRVGGREGRCGFTLSVPARLDANGDDDFDDMSEMPEHATTRGGLYQQQARHNEVFAKVMVETSRGQSKFLQEENRDLRTRVKELEAQLFDQSKENMKVHQDLLDMQFARNMEIRKLENEEMKAEKLGQMLEKFAPLLVASVFGGPEAVSQMAAQLLGGGLGLLPGMGPGSGPVRGDADGGPSNGHASPNAMPGNMPQNREPQNSEPSMEALADMLVSELEADPMKVHQISGMLTKRAKDILLEMFRRVHVARQTRGAAPYIHGAGQDDAGTEA